MLKIRNFDVAAGKGYIDFWHFDVAAGHGYIDFAGIKDLDSEPLSFPKRHKENMFWMSTQTGLDRVHWFFCFLVLRSMYPWGRATLRTPQRRVWELISNLNVRFHFNVQVIRQGKVNVSLGLGYIDFKTKFWKNINVAHSGSFESYDFLCDHLWLVSHPWSQGFAAVDPKGEKEWEGGDKRAAPEDALHSIREAAEEDARWSYYAQGHFSLMKYNIFFN